MKDSWISSRDAAEEAREREEAGGKPFIDKELMLREEYAHIMGDERWLDTGKSLPDLIARLHRESGADAPAALCLSGGGIRSATFSLGVLQWLATKRQLMNYHYLSTVSGGGYIGSFLVNGLRQAFLQGQEEELDKGPSQPERLERMGRAASLRWMRRLGQSAGTESAARVAGAARISDGGKDPIAPLRAFSNYLSPSSGLSTDTFALAAIFLRNLLLNLIAWLPVLAAVVALPRLYIAMLTGGPELNPPALEMRQPLYEMAQGVFAWWPLALALLAIILGIAYIVADLPAPNWRPPTPPTKPPQMSLLRFLGMPVLTVLAKLLRQLPEALQQRVPSGLRKRAQTQDAPSPQVPSNRFNLACFLPITGAAFLLSFLGAWTEPLHKGDLVWFALAGALAHLAGVGVGLILRKQRKLKRRPASVAGVISVVVVGAIGGLLTSLVLSHIGHGVVALQLSAMQRLLYASFSVPAMTGAFWIAMALHAGLMGRGSTEEDREWWARATAVWLKFTLIWIAAFGLLVWAPLLILEYVADAGVTAIQFGAGGGALGVLTAFAGYWSKHGDQVKSKARGAIAATGVKLLDLMAAAVLGAVLLALSLTWNVLLDRCYHWSWASALCLVNMHAQTDVLREQALLSAAGTSVPATDGVRVLTAELDPYSAQIAEFGTSAGTQVFAHVLLNGSGWAIFAVSVVLLAVAALMAFRMGANQFSLHGMYGNRLVRAYLGSGRPSRYPHWFTGFDPEDNPKLADLGAPLRTDGGPRLFPLINIALNLVKPSEKRLDWQQRKAASFFATPLHCGSAHLAFRPTKYYAGGMTLGRAMTISGAAASPNMGYHSSPLVTAVMTLFNVRLGWWSPNPEINPDWTKEQPALGLDIMLAEAGGATGDEDNFVYLSDGGHFDNTGIYEMVRRRCRHIVLVDATCDGEFKWSDLLDIVRKIRVDLGVPIAFDGELPGGDRKPKHPRRLTATLKYSSRDEEIQDGKLIVLKPMLLPGDPPELEAYARDSAKPGTPGDDPRRFPHQSTADQFFDEQQFESYRLLGWLTADAALGPDADKSTARATKRAGRLAKLMTAAAAQVERGNDSEQVHKGGIGELVQQMGSGMALATALAVGGTIGVAGSVAMKPGEVSLSSEDRALLKQGGGGPRPGADGSKGDRGDKGETGSSGTVDVNVPAISLNPADRQLLSNGLTVNMTGAGELANSAKSLHDAAKTLDTALERLTTKGIKLDTKDIEALQKVKVSIERVDVKDGQPPQDLISAINNLSQTVSVLTKNEPPTGLARALAGIEDAVKKVAPRQNIRGQEGGQR